MTSNVPTSGSVSHPGGSGLNGLYTAAICPVYRVAEVLRFRGRVDSVTQENIPEILLGRIISEDGKHVVKMDLHKELFVLREGQKVEFQLSKSIPDYRDGIDFVGRATVVSIKRNEGLDPSEEKQWIHILSIGGLLVVLYEDEPLPLTPTEKVYVRVAPLD